MRRRGASAAPACSGSSKGNLMIARWARGLLTAAVASLCGCGVQGQWTLKEVRPAAGNEDFKVVRASFHPDRSFEAVVVRDGRTVKAKGTYHYCSCRGELSLHMADRTRVLKASRTSCTRLHARMAGDDGDSATIVLRRDLAYDRHAACRGSRCGTCD